MDELGQLVANGFAFRWKKHHKQNRKDAAKLLAKLIQQVVKKP